MEERTSQIAPCSASHFSSMILGSSQSGSKESTANASSCGKLRSKMHGVMISMASFPVYFLLENRADRIFAYQARAVSQSKQTVCPKSGHEPRNLNIYTLLVSWDKGSCSVGASSELSCYWQVVFERILRCELSSPQKISANYRRQRGVRKRETNEIEIGLWSLMFGAWIEESI